MACLGFVVLVIVLVVVLVVSESRQSQKNAAFREYQNALSALQRDPSNPVLKNEAIMRGARYVYFTSTVRGAPSYDESMVHADVNWLTTGSVSPQPSGAPPPPYSLTERLTKLQDIKNRGLLSDQEFEAQKLRILNEL